MLDATGELLVAVSNMGVTDRLTVRQLAPSRDLLTHADLLVVDGNIPPAPAAWLLDFAAATRCRSSSTRSASRRRHTSPRRCRRSGPLLALTPNHDELCAIVGEQVPQSRAGDRPGGPSPPRLGVEHVWVRRGVRGSLLSSLGDDGRVRRHPSPRPAVKVVDVTGAGDSMTAAFVHAFLRGDAPVEAARFGQMAAALTVASPETVRPDLTPRLIDAELRSAQCRGTTTSAVQGEAMTTPHPSLALSPEVASALAAGRPVVALESTIISHGMPYPRNVEMAVEVEGIIRDGGATPATIAVLDGVPRIGLEPRRARDPRQPSRTSPRSACATSPTSSPVGPTVPRRSPAPCGWPRWPASPCSSPAGSAGFTAAPSTAWTSRPTSPSWARPTSP